MSGKEADRYAVVRQVIERQAHNSRVLRQFDDPRHARSMPFQPGQPTWPESAFRRILN